MAESAIRGGVAAAVPHDSAAKHVVRRGSLRRRSAGAGRHAARRRGPQCQAHAEIVRMDLDRRCARRQAWSRWSSAEDVPGSTTSVRCFRAIRCSPTASSNMPGRRCSPSLRRRSSRRAAPRAWPRSSTASSRRSSPSRTRSPSSRSCCLRTRCAAATPSGALAKRAAPPLRPHLHGRPGSFLSRGAGRVRPAERGRRHAGLELDPAPERGAALDCQGAGQLPHHAVTVEVRRMGGGFGGKETQAAPFACMAALLAHHTQRPVKLRLDRDDDMLLTGKRHDFLIDYEVGFDERGSDRKRRVRAGGALRLLARSLGADRRSGDVPRRQRLLSCRTYTSLSHRCKTHTVVEHRVSRFRRPSGHDGHRESDRCHCPRALPGPARSAATQSVRSGGARCDAVSHAH